MRTIPSILAVGLAALCGCKSKNTPSRSVAPKSDSIGKPPAAAAAPAELPKADLLAREMSSFEYKFEEGCGEPVLSDLVIDSSFPDSQSAANYLRMMDPKGDLKDAIANLGGLGVTALHNYRPALRSTATDLHLNSICWTG